MKVLEGDRERELFSSRKCSSPQYSAISFLFLALAATEGSFDALMILSPMDSSVPDAFELAECSSPDARKG